LKNLKKNFDKKITHGKIEGDIKANVFDLIDTSILNIDEFEQDNNKVGIQNKLPEVSKLGKIANEF
jgi:hypothetical protein